MSDPIYKEYKHDVKLGMKAFSKTINYACLHVSLILLTSQNLQIPVFVRRVPNQCYDADNRLASW